MFLHGQIQTVATQTKKTPKLDGYLDDDVWAKAKEITEFSQYKPDYSKNPSQKTSIRFLYDNTALYIGAMMYDTAPDSILTQLGNRDDELNSDHIKFFFDTYNNQSDAYIFQVSASGVQSEYREEDFTYDAVWESKVQITDSGWSAEIAIPYSAIRFPDKEEIIFGLQVSRNIRRHREINQWALEALDAENNLVYWGKLRGIQNIKTPIRLSITPYSSFVVEMNPENNANKTTNAQFNIGLDLKYGLSDAYTLDMILLPDFSQVQSDNLVKNLSAFETEYNEYRPFFNEAIDLFEKGDLFYSRRIGKTLWYFNNDNLSDTLGLNERVVENPNKAQLINATKISGRNKNGLAIGFLNAITADMYAIVEDTTGTERKILTEPLTNYNISVVDKAFKNQSSIYFINTNVTRNHGFENGNVTGSGFQIIDKSNTWRLEGHGAISLKYFKVDEIFHDTEEGLQYEIAAEKIKGKFQLEIEQKSIDKFFNANDLGLTHQNNKLTNSLRISYRLFNPWWVFRELHNHAGYYHEARRTNGKPLDNTLWYENFGYFRNYLYFWSGLYVDMDKYYDYYEPRTENRYFIVYPKIGGYFGISSDYRKTLAVDSRIERYQQPKYQYTYHRFFIRPMVRLSDKFSLEHHFEVRFDDNKKGFVELHNADSVFFGNRDVNIFENVFSSRYMIQNNLSLSLRLRHYWSKGIYDIFYFLNTDGTLQKMDEFQNNYDFNYNAFNIDFLFSWEFSPGSLLSLSWKNALYNENQNTDLNYVRNLQEFLNHPTVNTFSLKFLYYLDYFTLFQKKR